MKKKEKKFKQGGGGRIVQIPGSFCLLGQCGTSSYTLLFFAGEKDLLCLMIPRFVMSFVIWLLGLFNAAA